MSANKPGTNRKYRLAVIPGDGIGKEVVPEGMRVLEAAAKKFNFELELDDFDFASCDYYQKHGQMMPDDWKTQIGSHDAIFFGAVGMPSILPDHISLWGSLIQFRREFDQYVNLRPVRLMPGVKSPLAGRKPGDIDFFVVRENTEGEYSSIGGRMFRHRPRGGDPGKRHVRTGVDRILKFAFELAQSRPKKHLTSATKSNGISSPCLTGTSGGGDGQGLSGREVDKYHIDILAANFVLHPDWFDVVVGSNLFGDILSDLGPACTGTIGIAPSGSLNPERKFPRCLSRFTAPRRISPGRALPTRWARSGRRR
jgi:tartrate dehydrogenase/decarboxylase/D-malate dehydrogenase